MTRMFGPLGPGSIRSNILIILSASLGPALLTIPSAY